MIDQPATASRAPHPAAPLFIFVGLALLAVGGALVFALFKPSNDPPPAEIAADPLLVRGRVVYLDRCASCHGPTGKGDGPTAKGLSGPPVGNLTDAQWKHGDAPEQVFGVISMGVRDTQMPAWRGLIGNRDIRSATAYVYFLAGRPVPEGLRNE